MPISALYEQILTPDGDGTCQWHSTGAQHYTEVDDDPSSPGSGDSVSVGGPGDQDKIEEFYLSSPPRPNDLEAGFDQVRIWVWAWCKAAGGIQDVRIRARIKGAWTSYLTRTITGLGPGNGAWYSASFYNFCCQRSDADSLMAGVKAPSAMSAQDGVHIGCVYVALQASDVLTKRGAQIV